MENKTCLITGGCGFVGRNLTKRMLKEGYRVWILDDLSIGKNLSEWLTPLEQNNVKFIHDDVIRFFPKQPKLPFFDDIFHLASVIGGRVKIEEDPLAVAIDLAIDSIFFRWLVSNKKMVGRVLYTSSSAAYPIYLQQKEKFLPLKEDYISFDEKLGMPDMTYGWSKLTGEYLAQLAAKKYGISIACVRPFSGYGGDQDETYPIPAIALRALRKEDPLIIWGSGHQGRDFIYVDDCIDAMLLALDKIKDGSAINIGTGKLTTFREIASLFTELVNYSPKIENLIEKPEGVQIRYCDPSKMKETLKWEPKISLKEGLRRVLKTLQYGI